MLTIIFSAQFPLEKEGGFVSKQGQPHPHVHPKAGILTVAHNCKRSIPNENGKKE